MFSIYRLLTGDSLPIDYVPVGDTDVIETGMVIKIVEGKAKKASGSDIATHLCAGVKNSSGFLPVIKTRDDIEFCTDVPIADTSIGKKVTIAADSLSITETVATSGGFFICGKIGDGNTVVGTFVK